MSIPNFDKKIFKQITGIDVDKGVYNQIVCGEDYCSRGEEKK